MANQDFCELIFELQQLRAPSREHDLRIAAYCEFQGYVDNWMSFRDHYEKHDFLTAFIAHKLWLPEHTPEFTKSVDAALQLLPVDMSYAVDGHSARSTAPFNTELLSNVSLSSPSCKGIKDGTVWTTSRRHPNPAIAMCLAMLDFVDMNKTSST